MQVYRTFQQLKTPHFPSRMYVCALYEPSHKLIIYLQDIYWLVSVTEVDHVVRSGSMYIIWTTEVFKDVPTEKRFLYVTSNFRAGCLQHHVTFLKTLRFLNRAL